MHKKHCLTPYQTRLKILANWNLVLRRIRVLQARRATPSDHNKKINCQTATVLNISSMLQHTKHVRKSSPILSELMSTPHSQLEARCKDWYYEACHSERMCLQESTRRMQTRSTMDQSNVSAMDDYSTSRLQGHCEGLQTSHQWQSQLAQWLHARNLHGLCRQQQ